MCGSPARGSRVQGRRVFGWKAIGSVVPVAGCGSQATGSKIRRTLRIVRAVSQPWILAGEQSGLLTCIAATESVSLCEQMKS